MGGLRICPGVLAKASPGAAVTGKFPLPQRRLPVTRTARRPRVLATWAVVGLLAWAHSAPAGLPQADKPRDSKDLAGPVTVCSLSEGSRWSLPCVPSVRSQSVSPAHNQAERNRARPCISERDATPREGRPLRALAAVGERSRKAAQPHFRRDGALGPKCISTVLPSFCIFSCSIFN